MPEQNVSIKNKTTAGLPQCTAGSAYGSYGLYGNQALGVKNGLDFLYRNLVFKTNIITQGLQWIYIKSFFVFSLKLS